MKFLFLFTTVVILGSAPALNAAEYISKNPYYCDINIENIGQNKKILEWAGPGCSSVGRTTVLSCKENVCTESDGTTYTFLKNGNILGSANSYINRKNIERNKTWSEERRFEYQQSLGWNTKDVERSAVTSCLRNGWKICRLSDMTPSTGVTCYNPNEVICTRAYQYGYVWIEAFMYVD